MAESWFATLKTEIGTTIWATREQALADVFAFIQRYNRNRRHSTLDYLTPEEAELRYRQELPLAATKARCPSKRGNSRLLSRCLPILGSAKPLVAARSARSGGCSGAHQDYEGAPWSE